MNSVADKEKGEGLWWGEGNTYRRENPHPENFMEEGGLIISVTEMNTQISLIMARTFVASLKRIQRGREW